MGDLRNGKMAKFARTKFFRETIMKLFLCLVLLFLVCTVCSAIDPKTMDTTVSPCDNFYQYANGIWLKNTPIPPDRSAWGAGSELSEHNLAILHDILEAAAKNTSAPKGSVEQKVGTFYRSGMDEQKIEAEGTKPLSENLDRIAAIKDFAGLQQEMAHLQRIGFTAPFGFFVNQDFKNSTQNIAWLYQAGLGMPDRDYYLSDDPKMKEIRQKYIIHVAKMMELLGDKNAAQEAQTIMDMETRLAKVSMTPVEQRDPNAIYHKSNLEALQTEAPGINWKLYFSGIGLASPGDLSVSQPKFVEEVSKMMSDVPLENWKTYLKWQLADGAAPYLSSAFVNEDFQFTLGVIRGVKELRPRWKRVLSTTDQELGEALGQLFVAKNFPPEAKERAKIMIVNLKAALRDRLSQLDWISDETRKQAISKLDAIAVKVGYPDKWRDYSAYSVDQPSYLLNVLQGNEFEFQRNLNKIGKPIDRTEWGITAPTVDAYYNPNFNEIVFPAGILQPPFFDMKADDASNYGSIGSVIGHELTHGFDDQGRQFDADGNLKNWWTEDDEKKYKERAALIEKQYAAYVGVETMHINGKLTLGENIADNGGLKIAYLAFQKSLEGKPHPEKIDGFTAEQRFFLAFAQGWRRNTRDEALRLMLTTDPHSPPRFRVLGSLSNSAEFATAFGCKSAPQASAIW